MKLFVVRHVKAGDRSRWEGPDEERPASKNGRAQAVAIADRLEPENVSALISSPSLRCIQSVEPLADRLGLKVEVDERLAEDSTLKAVLAVVNHVPDRAVLCSHGDVIPELIEALVRHGMEVTTARDWRKATLWVLEATDDDDRRFTRAAVAAPPAV
jgi:broad specificity phosphatase PhoE